MQYANNNGLLADTSIRSDFRRFLESGGYCLPPGRAACALDNAKVLSKWREYESSGLVRLRLEPEDENYFDVYGEPEGYLSVHGRRVSAKAERDSIIAQIESMGCWLVSSQVMGEDGWENADSVGMCIHERPLDPFDNNSVIGLMQTALEMVEQPGEH